MNLTPENEPVQEAQLLTQVAEGDEAALASLYDHRASGLYSLALAIMGDPLQAGEVLQETWNLLWLKAPSYDAAHHRAFPWAVMILRRKAIDRLRARSTSRPSRPSEPPPFGSQLPDDQQQVVSLAFFTALTPQEIATRLNTNLDTVKANLRRGLMSLREGLNEVLITETEQDLAIAWLLGDLDAVQAARFESEMGADADIQQWVSELPESFAILAQAVPAHEAPPELRAKILTGIPRPVEITAEPATLPKPETSTTARPVKPAVPWRWLPATLGVATACLALGLLASVLQNKITALQLDDATADGARKTKGLENQAQQILALQARTIAQRKQIAELQDRDPLAQLRVVTLTAQGDASRSARVIVVWDDQKQQGLVQLINLPQPGDGKDYQMWILDPQSPDPVSAGILPIKNPAASLDSFKPDQMVSSAGSFAISVEIVGGVSQPQTPFVFLGK